MTKPALLLDFDEVLHDYKLAQRRRSAGHRLPEGRWQVAGMMTLLHTALNRAQAASRRLADVLEARNPEIWRRRPLTRLLRLWRASVGICLTAATQRRCSPSSTRRSTWPTRLAMR